MISFVAMRMLSVWSLPAVLGLASVLFQGCDHGMPPGSGVTHGVIPAGSLKTEWKAFVEEVKAFEAEHLYSGREGVVMSTRARKTLRELDLDSFAAPRAHLVNRWFVIMKSYHAIAKATDDHTVEARKKFLESLTKHKGIFADLYFGHNAPHRGWDPVEILVNMQNPFRKPFNAIRRECRHMGLLATGKPPLNAVCAINQDNYRIPYWDLHPNA